MANQTVSVNRNLDDAAISGLANGEDITVDTGAILTIDSDNRWSQQAAVVGAITISSTSGGQVQIDGTKVWWIPFDASSGNVPSLGTWNVQNSTASISLATGEFLGIFTGLGVAPSAAGGLMPTTGFIKFRSKVGDFVDNDIITLPGGATATVTGPGQRGWIHVVGEYQTLITVPRLGKLETNGDWFELGTTNGTDDQTFAVPVLDHIPAIQVETAVGSGIYEWWLNGSRRWGTTTQYIPTDLRGKFFGQWNSGTGANTASFTALTTSNGSPNISGFASTANFRVGQPIHMSAGFAVPTGLYIASIVNGTTISVQINANATVAGTATMDTIDSTITIARRVSRSCGFKPVTGLRVRIPNIIISTSGNGAFAGNILPTTVGDRWETLTTSAGDIEINNVCSNMYFNFSAPFAVNISNTCTIDILISNAASLSTLNDVAICLEASRSAVVVNCTNLFSGIDFNKVNLVRFAGASSNDNPVVLTDVDGATFTDCQFQIFGSTTAVTRGNANIYTLLFTRVSNSSFLRHSTLGGRMGFIQCQNITITDTRYADQINGLTVNTNPLAAAIDLSASCINILVDGFSNFNSILRVHPYAVILLTANGCLDIKMRNIGTSATPYDCGSADATGIGFSASVTKGVELKRIYLVNTRTAPLALTNTVQDVVIDNTWGDGADSQAIAAVNCLSRGGRWTNSVAGQTAVYGRHWEDAFTTTTTGRLLIAMNEPLSATADQVTITAGTPKFTSVGTINMPTLGDQVVWEMPYFAIGHTALLNGAPTLTGTNTGNFTLEYQIDLGSGYNGVWLALTGANLSSHTIPAFVNLYNQGGFRLKVRATVAVAAVGNALTYIRIDTVTTATEYQRQYPFYKPVVGYTGTLTGSNLAIYVDSTNDLVGRAVYDSGDNLVEAPWDVDYSAILRLRKAGYEQTENLVTIDDDGVLVPIDVQHEYATIPDTDPGALGITVTNHGASPVTWNSKDFSITIQTTNDALTSAQVANFINYNISQFATFNGFSGLAWAEMVIPDGANFQTVRDRLIGSAGATLKGVRVVRNDGTTPVPGFTQFQADDGTYYTPPTTITVAVSGLTAGSRVQIYDTTNDVEKFNAIVVGTSMSYSEAYSLNYNVRVRVMYATGVTADQFIEFNDTVTVAGLSRSVTPVVDSVYVVNAVDGFAVTGITIDDSALLIEAEDGTYSWASIYAYETAWLFSEEGIRDEGRFITALDNANYLLENFMIKNISSPTAPLILIGGWGRDASTNQTIDIIDTTGGSIFSNPDLVISYAVGSGLSPSEQATLSKIDTLTEDSGGLRFTTKALETAGGGSLTLADIADAVWDEPISGHLAAGSAGESLDNAGSGGYDDTVLIGKVDVIDANVDSIKAKTDTLVNTDLTGIATAANVSSAQTAIITEVNANETKIDTLQTSVNSKPSLANIEASTIIAKEATVLAIPTTPLLAADARLNNLDATISSRLASASYTAPANADIAAIKAKTDILVNTDLTGIATSLDVDNAESAIIAAVDANEAKIDIMDANVDSIKAKTDNLPTDPADNSEILSAISAISVPSPSAIADEVRVELAIELGRMDATVSSRATQASLDSLQDISQADIRTAVGLASANLDTQLAALQADLDNPDQYKANISSLATQASLDTKPTLAQIEASTILAKEATLATKSSQSSVNSIPTNPLLTTDVRLNNLNATISSRLSSSDIATIVTSIWGAATRSLNTDVTLSSSTANQIAVAVEAAIINEADGQQVIDAIVQAIGNENVTASTIASAVRTELSTELARIDIANTAVISAIVPNTNLIPGLF